MTGACFPWLISSGSQLIVLLLCDYGEFAQGLLRGGGWREKSVCLTSCPPCVAWALRPGKAVIPSQPYGPVPPPPSQPGHRTPSYPPFYTPFSVICLFHGLSTATLGTLFWFSMESGDKASFGRPQPGSHSSGFQSSDLSQIPVHMVCCGFQCKYIGCYGIILSQIGILPKEKGFKNIQRG